MLTVKGILYNKNGRNCQEKSNPNKEAGMDMDSAWEKIKKSVREGAAVSMEKIEEYSKIGKLKVEEFATKKKIERNFVDIGERAFDLTTDGKSFGNRPGLKHQEMR